ncbi:MAG: CPBP family intramembrane metalloprotease [Armatimonadetes bacterium]|nr:CPBP family intramembrane metalloprotease [Armatimonadota bacterium]MBS1701144.1 CPBP family intramembrane metalloprotease [Armatimonadota bacterium]
MQRPPAQFDLPPSFDLGEPPLPRMKWAWWVLAVALIMLVFLELSANDKKGPAVPPNTARDESISMKLSAKALQMKTGQDNKDMKLFDEEVDQLLDASKTDPNAQKLRIVLRNEDHEKPFSDDLKNLANSKDENNRAFARLFADPPPSKDESSELLKKLDTKNIAEKIAMVEVKERLGDKEIREKTFDPTLAMRMGSVVFIGLVGAIMGMIAWAIYFSKRQAGLLRPRGLPMADIDWGRADRLAFVALVLLLTFVLGGSTLAYLLTGTRAPIDLISFVPVYIAIFICLRVPIFGWRIMPEKLGVSLKGLQENLLWALTAFLGNIPIIAAVMMLASILAPYLPGGPHPIGKELTDNPSVSNILMLAVAASILAPIWEEIMFRGLLFPAFTKLLGNPIRAALLSSFIFASIHPQGVLGILPLMSIALMLCAVSYQTKSLVANMILHGLHNLAALGLALLLGPLLG